MQTSTQTIPSQHRHIVASTSAPEGYTAPVARDYDEYPPAHGCIQVTERCTCGRSRKVLRNGIHRELGRWTA